MGPESSSCLACLTTEDLFSIFDTHDCEGLGEIDPAERMLKNCFGIEVIPGSDSNTICGICMLKLRDAHYFKLEIAKNTTELERHAHLQLEYLEDSHSDSELQDKTDNLQNYDLDPELDPATGCLNYTNKNININTQNIPYFDKNTKEVSVKTYKNVRKQRLALFNGLQKDIGEKIDMNVLEKEMLDHKQTETLETEIQSKSCVLIDSMNNVTNETNNQCTKKSVKTNDKPSESNKKYFTLTPGQTECSICMESFHRTKKLHEHMNVHFPNHACGQCGKKFACHKTLKRHMSTHLDGPFPCSICDKLFTKLNTRNAHVWRVHQTANPYLCSACGDRFRTFHQRLRHQQQVHGLTEPKYPCPHCKNKYFYAGSRSQHIRATHLRERRFQCPRCPMAFSRRRGALGHLAAAHGVGEKPHRCHLCHKSFFRSTTLEYHLRTHYKAGKGLHRCTVCDAQFSYKAVLKCHMKCHEGVDDTVVVEDKIIQGSNDTVYLEYLDI